MSIKRLVPLNTVSLPSNPPTAIAGDIYYNSGLSKLLYFNGTDWIELAGSANSLVYAKSIYQDVRNQSGATIPIGTPVYISGAIGASGKILISPASNASEATSSKTMAITTSAISNNSNGQIISEGLLEGIDTTGASDGDPVWLGVNGAKIYGLANKPAAPAHLVFLGIVVNGGSANAGSIFVKIQNGFELQEIHNVELSSLINGNILAYDSTTSTWKNTNTLQSTSSTIPLVIKGAASQTANLQEWQNSSGTVLTSVDKDGYLQTPRLVITNGGNIIDSAGTTPYFGFGSNQIIIYARNAAYKPLVIQGAASQTANLQEWQTSTGSILGKLDKDGKLTTIDIESGALNATWRVYSTAGAPTVVPITAKGAASQTAKLQEWQNSAGTVVASTSVEGNGYFQANLNAASIGAGNNIGGASLTASPWSAATVVSIIRGYTSQSSDLTQWQNSAGTVLTNIDSTGRIVSTIGLYTSGKISIGGASWSGGAANLNVWTTGTATVGQIIRGVASQTADLQQWQSSTGTVLTKITSDGSINTSGASGIYSTYGFSSAGGLSIGNGVSRIYVHSTYGMGIQSASGNVTDPTLVIKLGSVNQTGSLQEWHSSTGTLLANVSSAGRINAPQFGSTQSGKAYVNTGTSADNNSWTFVTNSASNKGIVVVGAASQSANLQEWQNNSGTILNSISASGTLNINTSGTGTINLGDGVLAKGPGNGFTFNSDIIVLDGKGIEASSGKFTNVTGISTVPLIAKAISGQTANIQEWQNNSGQVRAKIDSYGGFSSLATTQIGNDLNGSGTSLIVYTKDAAGIPIVIKGFTSQTANLQEWQNIGGTVLAKVTASGQIYNDVSGTEPIVIKSAGSTRFELNQYSQGWSNTTFTFGSYYNTDGGTLPRLSIFSGTADTKGLIVRGFTSQSANLQEWQNISGTVLASISSSGGFTVPSLTVSGDFTVNGTTTNINTTNLVVEDKNITIADVTTPTDTTADGAGITIKGATDKTLNWVQSTGSFTSSEPLIISSNAANNITVFTAKDANNNKVIVNSDASNRTFITAQSNSSATGQAGAYFTADGFEESWFNINTRSNTAGQKYMRFGNLGNKFLVQRLNDAANVITSTPFTIENTSTTNSLYINSTGTIINGATALGQLTVYPASASTIGMVIRSAASQTANLTEWQDSTGYLISRVDSGGSHWINAVPATSGSVENSSAYLYLTSNRWTGSASTAEVFGLNNFRFGGAGAAGAFALHLKPASSANAYLSIAGDSSRSVGVNVQYPSASSGYGQFGVQIQDASYKGIVVKAVASQAANLQEWQDSSGAANAFIDQNQHIYTTSGRAIFANTGYIANTSLASIAFAANRTAIIAKAAASQTANIQEWQDNSGVMLANVGPTGGAQFAGLNVQGTGSGIVNIGTAAVGNVGLIIKSVASQTADLTQWQNSAGQTLVNIGPNSAAFNGGAAASVLYPVGINAQPSVDKLLTVGTTGWSSFNSATVVHGIYTRQVNAGTGDIVGIYSQPVANNATGHAAATSIASAIRSAGGASSVINSGYNFYANSPTISSGTITSLYGLYINTQKITGVTNAYGVYQAGVDDLNYLAGRTTIQSGGTGYVPLIAKGIASQTANLTEWQNSAGTVLAAINSGGAMRSGTFASLTNGLTIIVTNLDTNGIGITPQSAAQKGLIIRGAASQTANLQEWQNNSATVLAKVDANGNFSAISKSFDIPHPTKESMRLRYASLEGNEHGVYVRGTTKENVIELPEYWTNLVDESTVTVSLTSVGKFQKVYVEKIEGNKIYIGGRVKEISYAIFGERKDINKLIVEY